MKKFFFRLALPLLWVPISFVSYYHPGDEYGIYAFSNIIGTWIFFLVPPPDVHGFLFPLLVGCVGGVILFAVGFGMDKLRVNRWCWGVLWVLISMVLLYAMIKQYPTVQRALSKNGSWTAYIAGAMNTALYLSTIVSVMIKLVVLVVGRCKQSTKNELESHQ